MCPLSVLGLFGQGLPLASEKRPPDEEEVQHALDVLKRHKEKEKSERHREKRKRKKHRK